MFSEVLVYGVFHHQYLRMIPCKARFKPASADWHRCCILWIIILDFCLADQYACWAACWLSAEMFSDFNRAQSDKEGVKLLSVKTTSPETGECFLCVYVSFSEPSEEQFWDVIFDSKTIFSSCQVQVPARNSSTVQIPRLGACRAAVQLHCVWYQCLEVRSMTVLGKVTF